VEGPDARYQHLSTAGQGHWRVAVSQSSLSLHLESQTTAIPIPALGLMPEPVPPLTPAIPTRAIVATMLGNVVERVGGLTHRRGTPQSHRFAAFRERSPERWCPIRWWRHGRSRSAFRKPIASGFNKVTAFCNTPTRVNSTLGFSLHKQPFLQAFGPG
jgi:hypothetical protein